MSQERSEAVVLRSVDFSETSRIVTFLLPDRGRVACMAKGARRMKSAMAGALDTFNRVELIYYWKDSRQVQQLTEASLLSSYRGVKCDLERATLGAFALELAYRVAHENEPSHELYSALVAGLESLDAWNGNVLNHVDWQVLQLLVAAGFEPALDQCVDCGEPVSGGCGFAWRGGVTCNACPADRRLGADEADDLRALAHHGERCPQVRNAKTLFGVLRSYASHQLEADFRSVRVIDQMFRL